MENEFPLKRHIHVLNSLNRKTLSRRVLVSVFLYIHVYCPGVDDNGSGMAALLETARQIGTANMNGVIRNNTIIFVAFDLEEYGTKMHEN